MSTLDFVVPAVVVVGCLSLIMLLVWMRRDRTPRWSIDTNHDDVDMTPTVDPAELAAWHRRHSPTIIAWIAAHETVLDQLGEAELTLDLTDPSLFEGTTASAKALADTLATHPSPVMRAELSAMQVAADATLHAVRRADYPTAERQHLTYVEYRDEWMRRLRQFSLDDHRLVELRSTLSGEAALSALGEGIASAEPTGADDLRLSG